MQHVAPDCEFSIHVMQETLLSSVRIGFILIAGTARLLSTWQRSLCSSFIACGIQGAACRVHTVNNDDKIMDSKDDDRKVPSFDGRLDGYRDYRRRALLYFHGLEDTKQSLAAPRLIAALTGSAFECFRERDPGDFRNTGGVKTMLDILDARFQYTPEQELSEWMENLLYKLRRQQGEETTAFTTRFETTLSKTEDLITEELRLERRRRQDQARAEYRRQSLDYMVARQQHQVAAAVLPEGQTPPPGPEPPVPPSDPPQVAPFRLPEVLKGFLYLRHVGISLQTRASLLRSAGGSLRYDKVAELLRRTELDSLVAARGTRPSGHGYFADVEEEDYGDEYDDEPEEDYDEYYDGYGGYAEDEEEEDFDDDDAVNEEGEEEYNSAMIGYLEARKKLLSLRKARGFRDPPEAASGKGSTKGGKGKDSRPKVPSQANRVSRGDFQWRPGTSSTSSRATSQPRGKSGPSRRSKGQGRKPKGGGRRSSSGARRGDPNGSQYLGWATSAPSTSGTLPSQPAFSPEFSFMAGVYPRASVPVSEVEVERCLLLDRHLGLEEVDSSEVEQACLAVPPGHAVVDTGCTSTLVGSESERRWNEELQRQTGGSLQAERGPSDVKFEGINGEAKATHQVKYPVRLGGRDGFIKASVIPGRAPFLLSIQALRQMRAKLDCEKDVLEVPGIGSIQLSVNSVGHYLLPLFDFHSQPSPPPGLEQSLAAAEDSLGGPEDEESLRVTTRQDGVVEVENSVHPPAPCATSTYRPRMAEVSKRTDKLAKSVLLRLAKETRGPWVQLPQELAALYLILGRHGFFSPDVPWQIRAAQIGYRSKVVRKPPAAIMNEASVLVIALGDRTFRILKDWSACTECTGERLQTEASDARLFLFVFATMPQEKLSVTSQEPSVVEQSCVGHVSERASQALMVSHVSGAVPESAAQAQPLLESFDISDSEYFSCAEDSDHECLGVPVHYLGGGEPAGLCPRRGALDRNVCQWLRSDLALRDLSPQVQDLPRPSCQMGAKHRPADVQRPARLRVHFGSRAIGFRQDLYVGPRRSHPHGRRHHRVAQVQGCSLPVRCSQGHFEQDGCASKDTSTLGNGSSRVEYYQIWGQCGDSEAEDQSSCDVRSAAGHTGQSQLRTSGDGLHAAGEAGDQFWASSDPSAAREATAQHSGPQLHHECREEDDQGGVRSGAKCHDCRCSYGAFPDRAGCGVRGTSSRVVGKGGMVEASGGTDRRTDLFINGGFEHRERESRHSIPRRSRHVGVLGAGLAALIAACHSEIYVPPQHVATDPPEDGLGLTSWPRLSPEVSVEVPCDLGMQLPVAWHAVGARDMSKRATRAQLRDWLGPQSWKIDRGSTVGLIEVYTGRGRLSDSHEELCEGSEAIRLGHMYGQELRSPEGQWFTLSLIELCKPQDVYVSFPCKGWCRWSSFNERKEPGTRLKILQERVESRKDLNLLFAILEKQSGGNRQTHAENPQSSLAWLDRRFRRLKVAHGFVSFDQCRLGLRHPRSGRPIRKSTTLFTTQRSLAEHMSHFKCSCSAKHDRAEGNFQGRSVTSWCEDYSSGLAGLTAWPGQRGGELAGVRASGRARSLIVEC